MKKDKTLQDIQDIMYRIGCFDKATVDFNLHQKYLKESLENEDWRNGANNQRDLPQGLDHKTADHNNKIEITSSYTILYNCSPSNVIKSIIEQGPNWEYCKKHAYGKGVYTNLQEYQAHKTAWTGQQGYGDTVCKYKYNGDILQEFLVLIPQLWGSSGDIIKQCERFPKFAEMLNRHGIKPYDFQQLCRGDMSARAAQGLVSLSDEETNGRHGLDAFYHKGEEAYGAHCDDVLMSCGIQGFLYFGGSDAATAIVYNTDKLQLLSYAKVPSHNRYDMTSLEKNELKWNAVPPDKGKTPSENDTRPFIHFLKDKYEGNPIYLRPFCGEFIMKDKETGKYTFIDLEKAKNCVLRHQYDIDVRLFGDFEFEKVQNFINAGGKEVAYVQIDEDPNSRFFIDKNGNLYFSPKDEPISNIQNYYPDKDKPMDNDEDDDDCDFSFLDEEIVRPLVNNMMSVMDIIERTWKSPDDLYYIKIDQRFKDFRNFNVDKGLSTNDRGAKRWSQEDRSGRDSTKRENHVGYCIVRGRTKEDCKNAVLNATVHLNPWAAQKYGTNVLHSHGGMEAIIEVCHRFFARAYMVINPRSMQKTIDRARADKQIGRFKGREFNHRAGQSKSGFDGTTDWDKVYPDALIDCDISDPKAWKDVENLLKANGCQIYNKMKSHQGIHFIVNYDECKNIDFTPVMNAYPSFNKPGDPAILLKHDANTMVYSPAGVRE